MLGKVVQTVHGGNRKDVAVNRSAEYLSTVETEKERIRRDFCKRFLDGYPDPETLDARCTRLGKILPAVDRIIHEGGEEERRILLAFLSLGEAAVDEGIRYPHLLAPLLVPGWLGNPFHDVPDPGRDIAVYKRHLWLKILLRDRLGLVPVEETLLDFSRLADHVSHEVKSAIKCNDTEVALWAMGKWGGLELNASSDIDPVFFRDRKLLPEDADRFVREWIRVLSPPGNGEVYRVDLRLRPEGDAGPLAFSYGQAENYFFRRAASWERVAYLRARRVFGPEPGWFRELLEAFLFPSSTDPGARAGEVFSILAQIRSGSRQRDLKRAPGGIRDVEFLANSIQLTMGREVAEIRHGDVLSLLKRFVSHGLLKAETAAALAGAYRFLRRLENALQAEHDRAEFIVPPLGTPFHARLAWAMGFEPEAFETEWRIHREQVIAIVNNEMQGVRDSVFPVTVSPDPQPDSARNGEGREGGRIGSPANLPGTSAELRRLSGRWGSVFELFDAAVLEGGDDYEVSEVLGRLESAVIAYGGPEVWLSAFGGQAGMLGEVTRILLEGKRIVDEAVQRPYLWERLHDSPLPLAEDERCLKDDRLSDCLGDRLFHLGVEFILHDGAVRDLAASWSADVDACVLHLYHAGLSALEPETALIALGKWGGGEVFPAADLDLFLLAGDTSGSRLGELQRVGAEWLRRLELGGRLTPDPRLRPEGSGSPVVVTLQRLARYLEKRAESWEKIAFSRARSLPSGSAPGREAVEILRCFCSNPPESRSAWERLHRARMRAASLSHPRPDSIPLKKGRGGMMDLEFGTVFAAWKLGFGSGETVDSGGNWWSAPLPERMMTLFSQTGDEAWKTAVEDYLELRRWEWILLLSGFRRRSVVRLSGDAGKLLAHRLGFTPEQLLERWRAIAARIRDLYDSGLEG